MNARKKVGMTTKIVLAIILISGFVGGVVFLYSMAYIDDWDSVDANVVKTGDGWIIKFTYVHKAWSNGDTGCPLDEAGFMLNWGNYSSLDEINGAFDTNHTMIFFDVNGDALFNKGDAAFIYNNPEHLAPVGTRLIIFAYNSVFEIYLY